jgi:hypothetical protein
MHRATTLKTTSPSKASSPKTGPGTLRFQTATGISPNRIIPCSGPE